jgi:hypothetical protein
MSYEQVRIRTAILDAIRDPAAIFTPEPVAAAQIVNLK